MQTLENNNDKSNNELPLPRLSFGPVGAANVAGIGLTKLYEEIKSGRLKAKKFGKRTLVTAAALEDWLNSLPDYETETPQ
ncbi:MAG: helix-turn-helix domain-containing protein [Alphaproteobacteria bacterium]|nr:helix-turn-helix domain-containing protein [Alphaproteobacteria bacterium]